MAQGKQAYGVFDYFYKELWNYNLEMLKKEKIINYNLTNF